VAALATVLLVAFLCWDGAAGSETHEAKRSRPLVSAGAREQPNAATRSRMIEAEIDPKKKRVLSARDNAATEWRKAFALSDKLSDREKAVLNLEVSLDPPAPEAEIAMLLKKIAPIIALLRRGAVKPGCHWGISPSSDTPLAYLSKARFVSIVALFDASERIDAQPTEAAENLIAMQRLGNSLDVTIFGGAHNSGIQERVILFLARHGDSLPPATRSYLRANLLSEEALVGAFQESFRSEEVFIKNTFAAWKAGRNDNGQPLSTADIENLQRYVGKTPDDLRVSEERARKMASAMGGILYMPDGTFQKWESQFRANNPTPKVDDSVDSLHINVFMRERARETIVTQAMGRAALAIMDEGASALGRYSDPLTGKAFGYRVVDGNGSFQLQSEVIRKGQPVKLTFRRGTNK
jgi:hypothetical protein